MHSKQTFEHMDLSKISLAKSTYIIPIGVCTVLILAIIFTCFFTHLSACDETKYVYVDNDDNVDSVFNKVDDIACPIGITGFRTLMRYSNYAEHVRTGRYEINPGDATFTVFRRIKNGQQTPLNLTIPEVRTVERLAAELSKKLMVDSLSLLSAFEDEAVCRKYGHDTATIISMFIPNTYEIFWNISAEKLLERMDKESKNFWNSDRKVKAKALNLTEEEVITLASIIDEETANNGEKPMVAGMYYNRLQQGMPLQADPTVKFARKDFAARRVYRDWLTTDSPYNTYKNTGLPPGPIRIPSIAGIDAVLNLVHHDYLYMCAKEDFSGTHNFAVTYAEHQQNARRYSAALNARGIK